MYASTISTADVLDWPRTTASAPPPRALREAPRTLEARVRGIDVERATRASARQVRGAGPRASMHDAVLSLRDALTAAGGASEAPCVRREACGAWSSGRERSGDAATYERPRSARRLNDLAAASKDRPSGRFGSSRRCAGRRPAGRTGHVLYATDAWCTLAVQGRPRLRAGQPRARGGVLRSTSGTATTDRSVVPGRCAGEGCAVRVLAMTCRRRLTKSSVPTPKSTSCVGRGPRARVWAAAAHLWPTPPTAALAITLVSTTIGGRSRAPGYRVWAPPDVIAEHPHLSAQFSSN